MPTISSAGLGSGIDVDSVVSKLMAVESLPLNLLNTKEASAQAKLSALGTLKSSLSALQAAAKAIGTPAALSPMQTNVADSSILSATAGSGAVAGNYSIEVKSLAAAQKIITTAGYAKTTDTVGDGKLTIKLGSYAGGSFVADSSKTPVSITIDSSNHSLAGIRDAINHANAGVTASIINDGSNNYLSITSASTGTTSAIQISADTTGAANTNLNALTFDGAGGTNMKETVPAADADIFIDTVEIKKPSNTITDAIEGVTLNLTKTTGSGVTTKLSLNRDTGAIKTALQNLVKAYNDVSGNISTMTAYDASTGKSGALNGDSTVRSIQSQLRSLLGTAIPNAPAGAATLTDIGVSFQKDGTLAIDDTKLSKALSDPKVDMTRLFANVGTDKGYGMQLDYAIGNLLSPVGMLPKHTQSINDSITAIGKQRDTVTVRLAQVEARYRKQFSALDTAMSSMQQTSVYLQQQLAAIAANK